MTSNLVTIYIFKRYRKLIKAQEKQLGMPEQRGESSADGAAPCGKDIQNNSNY